jgi:hypothetical protein
MPIPIYLDMKMDIERNAERFEISSASFPLILLASDYPDLAERVYSSLREGGLNVEFAPGYPELESLAHARPNAIALLEISEQQSVEAAVDLALRLKRRNVNQIVGYLADPILHMSGLAGDGIFPRSAYQLPAALRRHFEGPI